MKITGNEPIAALTVTRKDGSENVYSDGLTIRQHFAAMALQGLLSNGMSADQGIQPPYHKNGSALAHEAAEFADLLIEALNK